MIKITSGKDNISLSLIAEDHWTNLNPTYAARKKVYQKTGSLAGRIKAHAEQKTADLKADEAAFFQKFCDHDFALLRACIKAPATSLRLIINYVEALLTEHNLQGEIARNAVLGELLTLFRYQDWRTNGGGYELFVALGNEVCVYCNLEDIKDDDVDEKFIGTFDHYYDKAVYPYLSMAISNLIPSCYPCNQTYKKKLFCTNTHVHPHIDDYDKLCTIMTDYAGDIDVKPKVWIEPLFKLDDRRLLIDTDLKLDRRYNDNAAIKQVRYIRGIIDLHPPERIAEISNSMGLTTEQIIRNICKTFDLPFSSEDILNTVYGKLKRDLALKHHLILTP
jgi:hypothetical protein